MTREVDEKLARSLTAETTELLPFLPYLLQDLWELGSNPGDIISLMRRHMPMSKDTKVLDLACGKGAVSVNIAKEFGINVYGFDLLPEFVEFGAKKARELNVHTLCHFNLGDVNELVHTQKGYDCVIFGAAGNILGRPEETLIKLGKTVKSGGFIIINEAYLPDEADNAGIKYQNYEYLHHSRWLRLFADSGLTLMEELPNVEGYDFDADNKAIAARAKELIARHPEKRGIFEGYVQSQLNECDDLENSLVSVTWMLRNNHPGTLRHPSRGGE
jgi:SAM-dependent methyltransferase